MSQHRVAKHLGRSRANPSFSTGYRRFAPAAPGFTSERAFGHLSSRLGPSAATTYASQRERGSMSVVEALVTARIQARTLGTGYPGGLECTPFRANRMPRFDALMRKASTEALTELERAVLELHVAVAGYRIEGPGDLADPDLAGRFWWTLGRSGWSGYEVSSGDWASRDETLRDAARCHQREADGRRW